MAAATRVARHRCECLGRQSGFSFECGKRLACPNLLAFAPLGRSDPDAAKLFGGKSIITVRNRRNREIKVDLRCRKRAAGALLVGPEFGIIRVFEFKCSSGPIQQRRHRIPAISSLLWRQEASYNSGRIVVKCKYIINLNIGNLLVKNQHTRTVAC